MKPREQNVTQEYFNIYWRPCYHINGKEYKLTSQKYVPSMDRWSNLSFSAIAHVLVLLPKIPMILLYDTTYIK